MAALGLETMREVVREDLDWLWKEWWLGQPDSLSSGDLRRASGTLRKLLCDGLLQRAWLEAGFPKQPSLLGPHVEGLAALQGLRLDLAASCVAGGGRQQNLDVSFIGAFRIDNPQTGIRADANEGFAVLQTCVVRDATQDVSAGPLDALVEKLWPLSDYLESTSAYRLGVRFTRREIVKYFANYRGGVHLEAVSDGRRHSDRYELIEELEGHVTADKREGLAFELLSIGQSVARAPDCRMLADALR